MPPPVVRFAPSPTGHIHIGNARTALVNFLFAKKHHGRFILRFDDTDAERSKPEFMQSIEVDLAWLGVIPDIVLHQSKRGALYLAAADKLREMGRLYPCYETEPNPTASANASKRKGAPPFMIARRSPYRRPIGRGLNHKGASHIGVSSSSTRRCIGRISCAAHATSIARRCRIRCSCARTGLIFILSPRSLTTSTKGSPILSAAKIM